MKKTANVCIGTTWALNQKKKRRRLATMTNYQHMTKIQNVNKPWHTMYIYPHTQYKIGDIIAYMWDDWKVIEVYT